MGVYRLEGRGGQAIPRVWTLHVYILHWARVRWPARKPAVSVTGPRRQCIRALARRNLLPTLDSSPPRTLPGERGPPLAVDRTIAQHFTPSCSLC